MDLSKKRAYLAMYYFLDAYYERTKSDEIGGMLGDMHLLKSGMPIDRAYWEDWEEACEKALNEKLPE